MLLKRMPPWFADSDVGVHFKNDRSLAQNETETLVAWAEGGAPEGNIADAPEPREYLKGWNIPKPDLVYELSRPFEVPAQGDVEYQYHVIPTGFTEDTWVRASEIRPDNREVVHHIIVFVRPPGSTYMEEAQPGEFYVPDKAKERKRKNNKRDVFSRYTPGFPAEVLAAGEARRIPAGSDFVVQLHYTPNGKPEIDRSSFGLVLATEPTQREVKTVAILNTKFAIPPGAGEPPSGRPPGDQEADASDGAETAHGTCAARRSSIASSGPTAARRCC